MFLQRLQELIDEKNISIYQLSKETGISEAMFSKWKKNKFNTPQKNTINKLSKFFGVSKNYLLGISDDKTPNEEEKMENELKEVYEIYQCLNDKNKKIFINIGKLLKESE